MQCRHHPERNAANTCNQCGSWLCDDCTVDINSRIFCRGCLAELSSPHTSATASSPRTTTGRSVSWGLLFLFSCFFPPGTNYMFMGLMKRGLVTMCGFFLLIFMTAVSSAPFTVIFALAIPVSVLACIFDGFNLRRRINAGEIVHDDIGDILGGLFRNKKVSLVVLGVIFFALIGNIMGFAMTLISHALPIIIVGLILYVIFKRKK